MIKKVSLVVLTVFFIIAGLNHFVNPAFYYALIPDYLPYPGLINPLAGVLEISLGTLLISRRTRRMGAFGLITLLIAFIPSHIYFIQVGGCVDEGLCVPAWAAWVRLVVIHPVLLLWIYWHKD